ncbi:MAG TPA: alpha/beta fold hydrolase, partial [Flavobacteriales bacterium]|nr:alpha/beta fold hydrolase [Flavobacteriales bacterium]
MTIQYFTHGVTLAYRTYGRGPIAVLAFHGFGRMGADFKVLEATLGDPCTLYAFDLHFHGESPRYPGRVDEPFTPEELATFFFAFTSSIGCQRITLLGYSLGGRLALSVLEQVP